MFHAPIGSPILRKMAALLNGSWALGEGALLAVSSSAHYLGAGLQALARTTGAVQLQLHAC